MGRKAKGKGGLLDLDDPEENEQQPEQDESVNVAKPKGKKGKKGKGAAFADDDDDDEDDTSGAVSAAPKPAAVPATHTGKKQQKGNKKGGAANKFAFGDDDDDDALDPLAHAKVAAGSDSEDEEPSVSRAAAKAKGGTKGKGKKAPVSAFNLLNEDSENEQPEEEDEEDEEPLQPAVKPKGGAKAGKGKKAPAASAFDLLEAEEEEEEAEDSSRTAFAALQEDDDDDVAGDEAPPAAKAASSKKSKKDKKGAKDMSSLFDALAEDGAAEPAAVEAEQADATSAEASQPASVKKSKKSKKDMSSLFDALGDDGAAGAAQDEPAAAADQEKKSKKKSKKDLDGLFASLGAEQPAEAVDSQPGAAAEDSKPVKKKKQKKDKEEQPDPLVSKDEQPSAAAEPSPAAEPSSSSMSKSKKGGKAAAEDDEELAAILAELEAPKPAAAEAGSSKKKKKKGKSGAAAAGDDDDIDALLAELDGPKAPAAAAAAAAAEPSASTAEAAAPSAPPAEEGDDDADGDEAALAEGKELTAAQKKKLKKKQKEKEKKAAAAAGGDEAAPADDDTATPAAAAAAAGGKKGKPVKESAAVRRMREELEKRQKAEEEARLAEEQRLAEEEAEAARLEEEERVKAEEKERKKAAAKAKKEELKRQGKLLTGKAKAEAERLAAMRAQLLAQAAEKGLQLPSGEAAAAAAAEEEEAESQQKKKKVVYGKKGQLQRKKSENKEQEIDDLAAAGQQEEQQLAEAAAAAAAAESAVAEEVAEEKESEGLDDWEQAADSWEDHDNLDLQPKAAGAAAAAAPTAEANGLGDKKQVGHAKEQAAADEEESEDDDEDDEEDDEDTDEEDEDSDEEDSSEEEESSSYESSDEESEDSEEERERRIEEARERRMARLAAARANADKSVLRSPICCILGHVDVGKTKILDNIRRTNVQDGEAGGITQQIGATFVPADAIERRTLPLRGTRAFDMKLPGLLVIDTPGHESFTNLRQRGSGLCDIAVLIVDLMHGLEQQTIESINMLKMRKTPFIIALNKCDRLYGWKSAPDSAIREAFKRQKDHVMKEFDERSNQVFLQLNEQGLNVSLYWKNPDPRKYVNVVPTSAITGEGIPDLLQLMVKLTQTMMQDRLMLLSETQCTVLEVKTMEGLGTTVDVVLVNGTLKEGDRIVVCGLGGPIVTRIKSLKTPQVLKEMRVKGALVEHKEVRAAMGVKIVAPGLESAVAGTSLHVVGPDDDEEELKESVMEDMADIFSKVDKSGEGVCVQASTLGSLEALLSFLDSDGVDIAVSGINIGPVHKRDVLRANVMNEKGSKKFAVILAFDVPVSKEARELATEYNVKIFTADIIYHLFDQFTAYMKQIKSQEQEAARLEAVFPCVMQILPTCVFNKKDPIVVGVEVVEGIAKIGTPLCVPSKGSIELGRIASLELNHKAVDVAHVGQSVAMKIEAGNAMEQSRMFGRHFDHTDQLVSKISRESINALKAHFADEMSKDDWRLVVKLKKVFGVQ